MTQAEPMESEDISKGDLKLVAKLAEGRKVITEQLSKSIVGQDAVIEELLIALFAKGNCLIVGVPGLAKTLLISSLAEINRTPPKTQAALLQAMQENHVTVGGQTYPLPQPFFVLATQNPIEQEGTYPLPEAQLDRFLFHININYPTFEDEKKIVHQTTAGRKVELKKVLDAKEVLALQEIVRRVPVADHVVEYAVKLARRTRPKEPDAPDYIRNWISWGAGPRASQSLILGGKARAILQGRHTVSIDDLKALAAPVLRHRLILSFHAEAEGVSVEDVIRKLLADAL